MGSSKSNFCKFILNPLGKGVFGFIIFFIVLVITKSVARLVGTLPAVTIDEQDAIICSIGFIMFFLIKFLENFSGEKS